MGHTDPINTHLQYAICQGSIFPAPELNGEQPPKKWMEQIIYLQLSLTTLFMNGNSRQCIYFFLATENKYCLLRFFWVELGAEIRNTGKIVTLTYAAIGEQNLTPRNMSFWHVDYFKLIIFNQ